MRAGAHVQKAAEVVHTATDRVEFLVYSHRLEVWTGLCSVPDLPAV